MLMSDNIIKNKNREIKDGIVKAGKRVAYQPEYERLNIEPVINKVNQHDFMMAKKTNRKLSPQQTLSQQKLPQSGQNEDIIWSQGLASRADRTSVLQEKVRNEILEKEDEEDEEDEEAEEADDQSAFELIGDHNRNFHYDDIPNVPSSLVEDDIGLDQEEQEEQEEINDESIDNSFKLSDLHSGDNILLYNDEVICVSGSLEKIKEVLSKILLNSNDYLVEEFIILKRLNIRAGIFIE